jgi:protein TonB
LSGNLSLDVSLRQDGTVKEINIRRSSGHKVLDEAAIEIVKLAAPFAPFPNSSKKEVDILHVTRTWKFVNDQNFSTR